MAATHAEVRKALKQFVRRDGSTATYGKEHALMIINELIRRYGMSYKKGTYGAGLYTKDGKQQVAEPLVDREEMVFNRSLMEKLVREIAEDMKDERKGASPSQSAVVREVISTMIRKVDTLDWEGAQPHIDMLRTFLSDFCETWEMEPKYLASFDSMRRELKTEVEKARMQARHEARRAGQA